MDWGVKRDQLPPDCALLAHWTPPLGFHFLRVPVHECLSSTIFSLRLVSNVRMDEATMELFVVDVVPKVDEVCCVSEFPVFVPAGPVRPKVLWEDGVGDVECPAFLFVRCFLEVEDTICLEGISKPNEHLSFVFMDVNVLVSQDTSNNFSYEVFVDCGFVRVLVDVVLRRVLNSLIISVDCRRLFR